MALGKIGKYEKLDVLGHGASGIVYLAWDTMLGKHVALKEISLQSADEARFLDEARVLDRLRHPNIVRVNSVDKIDGHLIIDMEYVKGTNLQEYMSRYGRLSVREALSVAVQISDALDFAHRHHTVHRDIKPANILISREGEAKIVDFGLAEILGSGSYAGGAGTYAYMAPEDFAEEQSSDHRSDIWAVGVTLYEMLAGDRPFQPLKTKDPFSWKRAVEEEYPEPLSRIDSSIPRKVEQVIAKALAKSKHERYQSIGDLRDEVSAILDTIGGQALLKGSVIDPSTGNGPDKQDELSSGKPIAQFSGKPISINPEEVDFGRIRKGDSTSGKLKLRIPGRGKTAGRIISQPGWLSVEPQAFNRRKQTLILTAGTESIWEPKEYAEQLVLKIEDRDVPIPVTMTVIPPRRQFIEAAWWYIPLFISCLVPLIARWHGRADTHTAAVVASGFLSIMLLIVAWVADLGAVEKILPAIMGTIGVGMIVGTLTNIYGRGFSPNPKEIMLLAVTCAPLSLMCMFQLLTASVWRMWAVLILICSACATAILMGWASIV